MHLYPYPNKFRIHDEDKTLTFVLLNRFACSSGLYCVSLSVPSLQENSSTLCGIGMDSYFHTYEILSQPPFLGYRRFRITLLYHRLHCAFGINRLTNKIARDFSPFHVWGTFSSKVFQFYTLENFLFVLKTQRTRKAHTILCEKQKRWWIKTDVECLLLHKTIRDPACSGFCNLSMSYFI